MTSKMALRRWAGRFGIGWFILFAIGAVVLQGQPPASDQPPAEVRQFFQDHGGRYLVGDYLVDVAFVLLFLPFAACLRGLLAAADAHTETLARLVLTGAVVMVVVGGTATAFLDAVALAGGGALDDSTVRALLAADSAAIAALGVPAALFTFAAALAIWRTAVLWRWLAVVGFIAGVLLTLGAAFPIQTDATGVLWFTRFVSFIVFAVFVLLISANLLWGRPGSPVASAPES
jgi:hypothetical protein